MEHPFTAYEGDAPFFFVSYAHVDAPIVFPEMSWIREAGFNLWYDDGIHVGAVWRRVLAQSLSRSNGLIFFCTSRSAVSDNCLKEINFALDQGKEVLVIQLDDSPLPLELQLSLNDRQALIKSKLDERSYQERLRTALSRLVSPGDNDPQASAPSARDDIEWTLALKPLQSHGSDELALIAQDLTHDLQAVLPNRHWIFRHKTVDEPSGDPYEFCMTGIVRQRGPMLRITIQMIHRNQVIWTRNYERAAEEFWRVQDNVVNEIIGTTNEGYVAAINQHYAGVPDEELDAVGLAARSYVMRFSMVDKQTRDRLLSVVRRMVAVAPEFAHSHALLATILDAITYMSMTRRPEETAAEAVAEIDRALALAPNDPFCLNFGAMIHRRFGLESLALKLGERCTDIVGVPGEGHLSALIAAGRTSEMLELVQRDEETLRLQLAGAPLTNLVAIAYTIEGNLEAALEAAQDFVGRVPQLYLGWVFLANQLALLGRLDEAGQAVAKAREMVPGWTFELQEKGTRISWRDNERVVEACCGGLWLLKDQGRGRGGAHA